LEKTFADCDKALQLDPKCALAYAYRGYAFWRKGSSDQALADFTQATRLNPRFALAYSNRGRGRGRPRAANLVHLPLMRRQGSKKEKGSRPPEAAPGRVSM
jgi:tetratricopeptide (TPR) repeat protein